MKFSRYFMSDLKRTDDINISMAYWNDACVFDKLNGIFGNWYSPLCEDNALFWRSDG